MHEYIMLGIGFILGVIGSLIGAYYAHRLQLKIENCSKYEEIIRLVLNPISQRLDRLLVALESLEYQEIFDAQ